jgi:hypothetical protein
MIVLILLVMSIVNLVVPVILVNGVFTSFTTWHVAPRTRPVSVLSCVTMEYVIYDAKSGYYMHRIYSGSFGIKQGYLIDVVECNSM